MKLAGVDARDIINSLNIEDNRQNVFQAGEGGGKSGSFFFFSTDCRFIIKTLRGNEKKILLGMLDKFIKHMCNTDGKSKIAKIFGLFRMRTKVYAPLDFIIMENVTQMIDQENFKVAFDLKGSTYGRATESFRPHLLSKKLHHGSILKDIDFIKTKKELGSKRLLNLTYNEVWELSYLIEEDTKFLASLNLMDYSLLLVIETDRQTGEKYCHMGIIDYLQEFDIKKWLEYKAKSIFMGKAHMSISCVPSEMYKYRMVEFVDQEVLRIEEKD
jgi:1-phosphatidylinositol-4-phosphate 5-kinase